MSVDSASMVDEIAAKVIEKIKGTLTFRDGGDVEDKQDSAAANFVGNNWRGYQRRGRRGTFSNDPPSLDPETQEITAQHKEGEIVVSVETLTIFSVIVQTAFAKLAETRVTMLGTRLALNREFPIHDGNRV